MKIVSPTVTRGLFILLLTAASKETDAFRPQHHAPQKRTLAQPFSRAFDSVVCRPMSSYQPDVEGASESSTSEKVASLKQDLLALGVRTERGFRANNEDRTRARELIFDLARYSAVREPARAYYKSSFDSEDPDGASVEGKWTLVYTDAPDITSLDQNRLAELGRIGQCCNPPYIKNVIEWKRPSWAANFPFAGTEESRVIQKVVTEATADPSSPTIVDLALAGFQVETDSYGQGNNAQEAIQREGLIAGLLQNRPVDVTALWNLPFGTFEILYLDDELRISKTGQNYFAVNSRQKSGEEWF